MEKSQNLVTIVELLQEDRANKKKCKAYISASTHCPQENLMKARRNSLNLYRRCIVISAIAIMLSALVGITELNQFGAVVLRGLLGIVNLGVMKAILDGKLSWRHKRNLSGDGHYFTLSDDRNFLVEGVAISVGTFFNTYLCCATLSLFRLIVFEGQYASLPAMTYYIIIEILFTFVAPALTAHVFEGIAMNNFLTSDSHYYTSV